jgi:hypothetical protein
MSLFIYLFIYFKVEQLALERDQQRVDLRRSLAQTEATARHSREDYERQVKEKTSTVIGIITSFSELRPSLLEIYFMVGIVYTVL